MEVVLLGEVEVEREERVFLPLAAVVVGAEEVVEEAAAEEREERRRVERSLSASEAECESLRRLVGTAGVVVEVEGAGGESAAGESKGETARRLPSALAEGSEEEEEVEEVEVVLFVVVEEELVAEAVEVRRDLRRREQGVSRSLRE
jgi:hypothetical protein